MADLPTTAATALSNLGLYWKPLHAIQTTDCITMLPDLALPKPSDILNHALEIGMFKDNESYSGTSWGNCTYSTAGKEARTRVDFQGGILLGTNHLGHEMRASFVLQYGEQCLSDDRNRAIIKLNRIDHGQTEADAGTSLLSTPMELGEVAEWDAGIHGITMVEKYQFMYGVLLGEAKGEWASVEWM